MGEVLRGRLPHPRQPGGGSEARLRHDRGYRRLRRCARRRGHPLRRAVAPRGARTPRGAAFCRPASSVSTDTRGFAPATRAAGTHGGARGGRPPAPGGLMRRSAVWLLLRLYPRSWRQRYGEEFAALLAQECLTMDGVLDIAR